MFKAWVAQLVFNKSKDTVLIKQWLDCTQVENPGGGVAQICFQNPCEAFRPNLPWGSHILIFTGFFEKSFQICLGVYGYPLPPCVHLCN